MQTFYTTGSGNVILWRGVPSSGQHGRVVQQGNPCFERLSTQFCRQIDFSSSNHAPHTHIVHTYFSWQLKVYVNLASQTKTNQKLKRKAIFS
jgi:hypothetical protein